MLYTEDRFFLVSGNRRESGSGTRRVGRVKVTFDSKVRGLGTHDGELYIVWFS
jgi:hypothetical protein